jgi:hypothetical protein
LALHFYKAEYRARIDKVTHELAKEELDGLLMFNQDTLLFLNPVYFNCLTLNPRFACAF